MIQKAICVLFLLVCNVGFAKDIEVNLRIKIDENKRESTIFMKKNDKWVTITTIKFEKMLDTPEYEHEMTAYNHEEHKDMFGEEDQKNPKKPAVLITITQKHESVTVIYEDKPDKDGNNVVKGYKFVTCAHSYNVVSDLEGNLIKTSIMHVQYDRDKAPKKVKPKKKIPVTRII